MNTTCAKNVLTRTPGDTEHDVLPLTPTPEFPSQDKPRHRPGVPCRTHHKVVGTQPRPVFGNIDYQSVIKCTVETQSKKVHVSTPMLKLHLIINDLRNPPWPHPASSTSSSRHILVIAQPARQPTPATSPPINKLRNNPHTLIERRRLPRNRYEKMSGSREDMVRKTMPEPIEPLGELGSLVE